MTRDALTKFAISPMRSATPIATDDLTDGDSATFTGAALRGHLRSLGADAHSVVAGRIVDAQIPLGTSIPRARFAKTFEPTAQTIRNCMKQADLDASRRTDGLST